MKTFLLLLSYTGWALTASFAAEAPTVGLPPKLVEILAAQDNGGKPIIPPEQRAYFDGLNDHLKELLGQAVNKEFITRPEHLELLLRFKLPPQKMELVLQDNCLLCHTDAETQSPGALFSLSPSSPEAPIHRDLKDFLDDTHFRRGLSCAGCHGGDPAADFDHTFVKEWPATGRQKDRAWILAFCGRCHSDPALMNRFNPALPTDQLAKFKESPHGKALLETKDQRAPQCVSCHDVHGIRPAKDPLSKVYAKQVPATCGACHADPKIMAGFKLPDGSPLPTNQLAEYRTSVHGRALLDRGDLGAPACNDCHGNHAAMPVGLSNVSQSCSLCHVANASLFDGSKHKQAFEQHQWPQCGKCHGNHAIGKTHDAMLGLGSGSLCVDCHQQFAQNNPECNATAAYFYETITQMHQSSTNFSAVAEDLAAKGLDVDAIDEQLGELADDLKKARTQIHSFNRNSYQQIAAPGATAVRKLVLLTDDARAEFRLRQLGLIVSIVLTGLVMLAIYLKLRRLERP